MPEPHGKPPEAAEAGDRPTAGSSASDEADQAAAAAQWLALVADLPSLATHAEVLNALDAVRDDGVREGCASETAAGFDA